MVILRLLHQTRRRIDLKHIAHIFLPLALWFALQKASHYNFNDIKNNSEKIKNDRTVERSMEIIALNTVLAVNNCKKKNRRKIYRSYNHREKCKIYRAIFLFSQQREGAELSP